MRRSRRRSAADQTLRLAWRASRPGLALVFLFGAFTNVMKLALPLYLIEVLDRVPASRSVGTLVMLTIVALLAITAGLALEAVRRRMLARWGRWIEQHLGYILIQRRLGGAGFGETGGAQDSLDDLATLRAFVSGGLESCLNIVWIPFFVLGAYVVHPVFGLMGAVAIALLVLLGVLQDRTTRESRHAARRATASAGDLVVAAERNMESVGALSMTPHLADRWQRLMAARGDERERIEARVAFFTFLKSSLRQSLSIGAIGVGVWLFLQNALTLGSIFAGRIMLGFGYRLADRAVGNWRSLRYAGASYAAIKQQLRAEERPPASVDGAARGDALILEEVSFRYRDQRDSVIRNLSLTLDPGEVLLVTGTATTGKTTLSRLLVGLLEPRYGQVRLGDIEIGRLPVDMRADLIGYLPQHTELFSGTVRENIARMRRGDFQAIVAAAKLIDIHDTIIRLPEGYDTVLSGETVGLSGSEFKRIAIARAIYGKPRLLVLDEPAANLDRPSRRTLQAALVALKQQGCSVVITQAMESARTAGIADKFLILGGRSPEYSVGRPPADRSKPGGAKPGLRSVT